jgi:hypothetical protein
MRRAAPGQEGGYQDQPRWPGPPAEIYVAALKALHNQITGAREPGQGGTVMTGPGTRRVAGIRWRGRGRYE